MFSFEGAKRNDFLIYERFLDRGLYEETGSEPPGEAGPRVRAVTVEQRGVQTRVLDNPTLRDAAAAAKGQT